MGISGNCWAARLRPGHEWIRVPPATPFLRKEKDMSKGRKTKHGKAIKKQQKKKK
jgi:hypothetical protein